jgi:hypothetical protein
MPYASDRILNTFQQNQNQSDLSDALVTIVLELLSAGGLVADSLNPAQSCIDYVAANCQHSAATLAFSQALQAMSQAYAQQGQ